MLPVTVAELVALRASERPDERILTFEDSAVTYGELHQRSSAVAGGLAALGLSAGDRFAVMLTNGPECCDLWVAAAHLGLVEVPLNTALRGQSLAYQLQQSASSVVVVDASLRERVEAVRGDLPDLRHIVVVGEDSGEDTPYELLLAAAPVEAAELDGRETAAILYTSGTTGPSKGAMVSHRAAMRLAQTICEAADFRDGEVLFTAFPLFHTAARNVTVLPAMLMRGRAVVHQRFSASRFWDLCRAEGVTSFNYMGAVLSMLCKQEPRADDTDHPVRSAFGAGGGLEIATMFRDRFGVPLFELYGMTETGTVTMNTVADSRFGSCGRAMPYYEVEIHDDDDTPLPAGETGEIVVRPREPGVLCDGYFGMPEASLTAMRNLWFHTGDRGRMDADGYLYFVDRKKDSIRRRGENISSWEVERVLTSLEGVLECAVVGVPSDLGGGDEEVLAVLVVEPGAAPSHEQLVTACEEHLPHFAVPRYLRFVEDMPRTPSARVEKFRLRELGLTADTWDRMHPVQEMGAPTTDARGEAVEGEDKPARVDGHTAFLIRDESCTGCSMCVLACASIKNDVFSFGQSHGYIEVKASEVPATFTVRFTEECDGCTYCLSFCGFDAIEMPEIWVKPDHLDPIRRRHKATKAARNKAAAVAEAD